MHTLPVKLPPTPWHRQPWPWLLMLGPALVVVAGVATAVLAFRGADGLVAEDYYKQGLAINRVLAREQRAAMLGVKAKIWHEGAGQLRAEVSSAAPLPAVLNLRLAHPTRAGQDQLILLRQTAPGVYAASAEIPAGRWHVVLESVDWRVAADWRSSGSLLLDAGRGAN